MKYIKQIDSLRAIAVLLVIVSHWIPNTRITQFLPLGQIGVDIFFVISGFLITRILLNSRIETEETGLSMSHVVKTFYIRRALRIFPIYYLVLFVLLALHNRIYTDISSTFVYYATYATNFYFFKVGSFDGMVSHLWSLAVEEQFYFIWPWLMLFVNRKYLLYIIIGFIVVAIGSQYAMANRAFSELLPWNCFDAFGLGALLSWQLTYKPEGLARLYKYLTFACILCAGLFVAGAILKQLSWILPLRTSISVISVWTITYIIRFQNNLKFKFILNNKLLWFLGKISYGLYLYHNIIPGTLNSLLINKYLNPLLPAILYKKYWAELFLLENAILLLLVSWVSYTFFEKKILDLKKYFDYQRKPVVAAPAVVAELPN